MAGQRTASVTVREELCIESRPEACGVVIFGASGDLSHRKLIPSLYHLSRRGLMPQSFYLIGCLSYGDSPTDDSAFQRAVAATLARDEAGGGNDAEGQRRFAARCAYQPGNYQDSELYRSLARRLEKLDREHGTRGRHLFYLAVPPTLHGTIVAHLGEAGLVTRGDGEGGWTRVVVEKPFGRDLESARQLSDSLRAVLDEGQIYRIDHYLGKETVQNILMLRFANAIFEPVWNREHVDHVQVTVAESIGVEHRAGYYEQAGCLRDMFQNHMLQLLSLVTMEPPAQFEANRYRDEKVKLLHTLRSFAAAPDRLDPWLIRAQYGSGEVDGRAVPGYRNEPGVAPDSVTETYVATKLLVDNWRWAGVPFYLRSGKRLQRRVSEVAVAFKPVPHSIFHPILPEHMAPNMLVLNVQPEEGISLTVEAKQPGAKVCMGSLTLHLDYRSVFGVEPPEAYERLLLDAMLGDQTLFVRTDGMEAGWSLLAPILEGWEAATHCGPHCALAPYAAGSWGPSAADALLAADGRAWRVP